MSANRAVVVDPEAPGRLVIQPVAEPVTDRGEALVRVRAISLNRGEVRRSGMAAAGWRPGFSTDYDAIILAKYMNIKQVINLSNIDFVYDKDPKKFPDAKKIEKISWKDFRKIVGDKWDPGMNAPFDPIASKIAQEENIEVAIMNGKDLTNLENYLNGKEFKGTVIR